MSFRNFQTKRNTNQPPLNTEVSHGRLENIEAPTSLRLDPLTSELQLLLFPSTFQYLH